MTGFGVATKRRPVHDSSGRQLGSKGQRTRQQLIEATVQLLQTHGLRDVSVVDVARLAETSPATFYVYFKSVPDVVLAALDNLPPGVPGFEALLDRDWSADEARAAALDFVEHYAEFWNRHRTIFVVRNLASEEGDARFYTARIRQAAPVMAALCRQLRRAQDNGRLPPDLSPEACAGTLLMMLERLSAIGPISQDHEGISYAALKAAAAHNIAMMLGAASAG